MKKFFEVEVEMDNMRYGGDHCKYAGNDYQEAISVYRNCKEEYDQVQLTSYKDEEERDNAYWNGKLIYRFSSNRKQR